MAEQSRNEEILRSIIDETEYDKTPQSREEELLLELKQAIEGGGSSVVPNPEGEATETLNKLGIDDTVYGIPKELPAVTSADNGNVLSVVDGAWAKVALSGSWFVAKATSSGSDSNSLDKTQREIFKAVTYNATQVGYVPSTCNPFVCLLMGVRPTSDDNYQYVVFSNYRAVPYGSIVFYAVATFASGTYLFEASVSYDSTSKTVRYTAKKLALASDIPT